MDSKIITKLFQDKEVLFDSIDGEIYLNATITAKSFGKRVDKWKENSHTVDYLKALSNYPRRGELEFIISKEGRYGGTWIHKKLIIVFARWLSPEFAVWCDEQIEEILQNQSLTTPISKSNYPLEEVTKRTKTAFELIDLLKDRKGFELILLEKILSDESPTKLLGIDFSNILLLPTELGKLTGHSAIEINQLLYQKGYQVKIDGVWKLTEKGKPFGLELQGKFHQIKWRYTAL